MSNSGKVKCTCGWSWNKSDSSKKDMYICHECGRDNSNNMKDGGWLDNYNDYSVSAPEGFEGDGYSNVGRNSSPAWGGQFQEGGEIPIAQGGNVTRKDSIALYNNAIQKEKYYKNNKNYYIRPGYDDNGYGMNFKNDELRKNLVNEIKKRDARAIYFPDSTHDMGKQLKNAKDRTKQVTQNVYSAPDFIDNKVDYYYNPKAPPVFISDKIRPQGSRTYHSDSNADATNIPYYDPLAVKPFDLLSDKEKQQRVKQYGTKGVPKSYLDKKKISVKTSAKTSVQTPKETYNTPQVQSIENNLHPAGLVYPDNNIEADVDIRNKARIPKYYDVIDKVNQNFGGSESKYKYYPENGDLPNVAPSPYNTRTVTPHYQMGGSVYPVNYVPQAQNGKLTFLQPTSEKLPEGYRIPYADPSSERAMSIGGENGEPAYLIPSFKYGQPLYDPIGEFRKTKEHLGGPFKTWQEADEWEKTVRHPAVEKGENIMFPQEKFAMGGTIAGAPGFSYARTQGAAPSNGKYAKKTMASAQNGKEMQYYQQGLDWQPKTISKNGGWLDGYDVAQEGTFLPSVRDLITDTMNRKIQTRREKDKETNIVKKDNTKTVTPKIGKVATAKEKEQRAIEENKQAQEASDLQSRKDQVFESMQEAYKSPLMSPGYFTPEGVAIGALQGATKLGPDLYEGNYKGAAMDALMALPIGIPAAKTLGRALGPEEGLIGKVSQEVNINRNLSKIKKEGQLQGLSEHEIAKKQMEQVGITSNQRKGYTPLVSEFAEKYIKPRNYTGSEASGQTKFQEIIENIKQGGYKETFPQRTDAWKLYLGRPQVNNTFSLSDTAPAIHPSYKPGSLEGMDIYNIKSKPVTERIGFHDGYTPDTSRHLKILENPIGYDRDPAIMGGYNKILTKEGTQYNDIWDLEPGVNLKSLFPNAISENSKFENIFYKTNSNGTQSPRGFKIPVEKFVGKPFMSHGNLPYTSTEHVNLLKENILLNMERFKPQVNTAFEGPQRMAKMQADLKNLENYPKYKKGGIIKDDRGQWDHPGEITEIGSNRITMQGVPYPVLGVSDTGDTQMMYPEEEYEYDGEKVTEYPMAKNGMRQEQKGLQNLDNLTNFTNYNTEEPGGWLEKFATGGSVAEVSPEEYTIQEGNTLFEIARDKNIPLSTLAAANKIENPDLIRTGNKLAIPKQFKKELSFAEIPTADNKKVVIDNFSPHYDYIIEGDKTYYKVKSGNTWADISNNKQARANLTTFLDKNNYWAGYGSGEKAKYDKVHHQPVVVPGGKVSKTQPSIIKNTETGNKPVIVKRPITKVVKEEPSFFDDISHIVSSGAKSLENKWGDIKKETKNIVKDVENTVTSGLNNAISTTEDAYHTILNGVERKFKTHTGQDDDAKVVTSINENPKTVKEWYGNKSGAEITQVIDAPNTNGRTYKQQVLPASNIKFGVRNRGEYKDIKTDGLEVTTFNPFTKDKLPDETSVLAIDGKGNLHTGQYKDFKGQKDYMFSSTFRNKIVDFPEVNGKGEYVSGAKSGNPKYQQPKIKVLDDNGKVVNGSLNILVKDDSKKDYYGQVQGGRILFVNPTTKEQYLVSGSMSHIKQKFKELKGNNKYLEAYTLDNGTYSRGLSYKDKKLTKDRLKSYDLENTGGGNGLYILDYKQPVSKYEEDYIDSMPNVRTKNDTSYKKGHPLKNEVKNIVLHHTAYTGPNAEKELNKQYMTPGQNSSHIVIQENGKRSVYASPEQVTFHAGESEWNKRKDVNDFSIGVEFQGDTNKKPLTQAQIESFVEYYAPIAKKYNLSLKDIITHQMIAPGRKPDINEKQYARILKYMTAKNFK